MIKLQINNNKKIIWNYKRCWDNIKPIIAIILFFLIYGIISTIDYYSMYAK